MNSKLTTENIKTAKNLQHRYHWIEAAILYENLIEDYRDQNKDDLMAETSEEIAYSYFRGARMERDPDRMRNYMKKSISYYEDASKFYYKIENISKSYLCNATSFFIKGLISQGKTVGKSHFGRSLELFRKTKEEYLKNKQNKHLAKIFIKEVECRLKLLLFLDPKEETGEDIKQRTLKIEDELLEAWKYAEKEGDIESLVNYLHLRSWLIFYCFFIESIRSDERYQKKLEDFLNKCNNLLDSGNNIENPEIESKLYQSAGFATILYSVYIVNQKNDYEDHLSRGLELLNEGVKNAEVLNDVLFSQEMFLFKLFGLVLSDNFNLLQKALFEKKKQMIGLLSYLSNFNDILLYFNNLFLGLFYLLLGKQEYFTEDKRFENLEESKQYIINSKSNIIFFPLKSISFQVQSGVYKYLILKDQDKAKQQNYILELLENIDKSKEIIQNLESGYSIQAHYLTIYETYRVLSKIAEDVKDKFKMLNISIDYLKRAVDMHLSPKKTQLNLEFLLAFQYKELAENFEKDYLPKSIETLRNLFKNCQESNFLTYGAFAQYYLGKIADQNGNYKEAEQFYKKSKEIFAKLFEKTEEKTLKEKIKEFTLYTKAWEFLERSKFYYQQNKFSASEKEVVNASDILRKLEDYNYESIYYSAWIILEKAESLSFNNKYSNAINSFELAQESFKNSLKSYQKMLHKSNFEVQKYLELSNIRRRYCKIRINIEEIRQFESNKQYTQALDRYDLTLKDLNELKGLISNPYDKKSFEKIFCIIEAWKNLLLAENIKNTNKFSEASKSFKKCCIDNEESKQNFTLMANSSFYKALSYIFEIDKAHDISKNAELVGKGRALLNKAKAGYNKANRKKDAIWTEAILKFLDGIFKLLRYQQVKEDKKKSELLSDEISKILKSAADLFIENEFSLLGEKILETIEKIRKDKVFSKELLYLIRGSPITKSVELIKTPLSADENSIKFELSNIKKLFTEEIKKEEIYEKIKKYNLVFHDFLKKFKQFQWRESTIAIVQTSIDTELEDLESFYYVNDSTFRLKKEFITQVKNKITDFAKKAYQKRAKLLIFPCFFVDLNYGELLNHIISLSKEYKMMIIPGSYHSQDSKRIIAPVISKEGILWQQVKQVKTLLDLKGDKLSKKVKVNSPKPEIHVGNTEVGRIVIVDCQDFLDDDLRKELMDFEPKIDILINLAFSSYTDDFKTAHIEFHKKNPIYSIFINSSNFGESFTFIPSSNEMEHLIESEEESIIFLETDLSVLRRREKQ